jgi:hypothetical protein
MGVGEEEDEEEDEDEEEVAFHEVLISSRCTSKQEKDSCQYVPSINTFQKVLLMLILFKYL